MFSPISHPCFHLISRVIAISLQCKGRLTRNILFCQGSSNPVDIKQNASKNTHFPQFSAIWPLIGMSNCWKSLFFLHWASKENILPGAPNLVRQLIAETLCFERVTQQNIFQKASTLVEIRHNTSANTHLSLYQSQLFTDWDEYKLLKIFVCGKRHLKKICFTSCTQHGENYPNVYETKTIFFYNTALFLSMWTSNSSISLLYKG